MLFRVYHDALARDRRIARLNAGHDDATHLPTRFSTILGQPLGIISAEGLFFYRRLWPGTRLFRRLVRPSAHVRRDDRRPEFITGAIEMERVGLEEFAARLPRCIDHRRENINEVEMISGGSELTN